MSKWSQFSNANPVEFDWVKKRHQNANNQGNIRDYSSIEKLLCVAISQMQILLDDNFVKGLEQEQP